MVRSFPPVVAIAEIWACCLSPLSRPFWHLLCPLRHGQCRAFAQHSDPPVQCFEPASQAAEKLGGLRVRARLYRLLKNSLSLCFVSGHDFSRAVTPFTFVITSGPALRDREGSAIRTFRNL